MKHLFNFLRGRSPLVGILFFSHSLLIAQGGYAIELDGTNDRVEITHDASLNLSGDGTFEAWVYLEDVVSDQLFIAKTTDNASSPGYNHTGFYINYYNQRLMFSQGTAGGTLEQTSSSLSPISANTWTHVAAVKNGAAVSLYVNGLDVTQTSGTHSSIVANTADVLIGSWDTDTQPFDGYVDEVRVWSDVRTTDEIRANMFRELSGSEAGLLFYYAMSDGSGASLTDNSSNAFSGAFTNGPNWRSSGALAGPARALDLDGSDDYVLLDDMDFSGDFTLSCWLKAGTAANTRAALSKQSIAGTATDDDAEWALLVNGNDSLNFFMSSPETSRDVALWAGQLTENRWYHVSIVMSGTTASLYLDGLVVDTDEYDGTRRNGTQAVEMGRFRSADTTFWLGELDEVRVWGDARTAAEIRDAMYRTLGGDETDLEAYYRLDLIADAGHSTAYDLTANAHNGTLTNMDASTDRVASSAFNTWLGGANNDVSNTANWSLGSLPGSSSHVGIFRWEGATSPLLESNRILRQVYVASTASLSLGNNTLTLDQHLINEGSLDGTGGLTFGGIVDQNWLGSGSAQLGTLTLNNSQGLYLNHSLQIDSTLQLTSGVMDLGAMILTLDTAAVVGGTPSDAQHVNASSGTFRKLYNRLGSMSYPLGDGAYYSPIVLNFTSGTLASAYADLSLTDSRHPQDTSGSNYITRYWSVTTSGISSFSCTVTATYVDADVVGDEGQMMGAKWNGTGWAQLNAVDEVSNSFWGTVTAFSDFTARDVSVLPLTDIDLSVQTLPDQILLQWEIWEGDDVFECIPEKLSALGTWDPLGRVQIEEEKISFSWPDRDATVGPNYYRIKAISRNGSELISPVTVAYWQEDFPISLYPIPCEDVLHVQLPTGFEGNVVLRDQQGREVCRHPISARQNQLNLQALGAGVYFLQVSSTVPDFQSVNLGKLLKK